MKHDKTIETLNELIKICNDGSEGFSACAENAKITSGGLKNMLVDRACECEHAAVELSSLVTELGGVPAIGGTAAGTLHRGWLNVKSAISGKTDLSVLEECARGEDVAKQAYQKAIAAKLPEPVRVVVERQYQVVLKNHDLIENLLDEARIIHV